MAIPYIPSEKSEDTIWKHHVRYPWSDWLNGMLWKLTAGEDFKVSPASMAVQAHVKARYVGLKVRTRVEGDVVWIQSNAPLPDDVEVLN